MSDVAIKIQDVSKVYGLPYGMSLAGMLHGLGLRKASDPRPEALKNINLEVKRGEILGLIGRNGAGKSTLLKMIAGVSPPTTGSVSVNGSVFPMIELNAGMNVSFTGRENVMLLASILGLSPREIRKRMKDIEEFCNLGEWFDRPVRTYSSGMPGRLGFAVAVYSDADILLIDEVLAVGDVVFRDRCMEKIEALRNSGKTVVFASHNMSAIAGLCTRTVMIELGEIRYDSVPTATIQHYKQFVSTISQKKIARQITGLEVVAADGYKVHGLLFLDQYGMPTREIKPGDDSCGILMDCEIPLDFDGASMELMIVSNEKVACVHEVVTGMHIEGSPTHRRITVTFPHGMPLHPGEYLLTFQLTDTRDGREVIALQTPLLIASSLKHKGRGVFMAQAQPVVTSPTIEPASIPPIVRAS